MYNKLIEISDSLKKGIKTNILVSVLVIISVFAARKTVGMPDWMLGPAKNLFDMQINSIGPLFLGMVGTFILGIAVLFITAYFKTLFFILTAKEVGIIGKILLFIFFAVALPIMMIFMYIGVILKDRKERKRAKRQRRRVSMA